MQPSDAEWHWQLLSPCMRSRFRPAVLVPGSGVRGRVNGPFEVVAGPMP